MNTSLALAALMLVLCNWNCQRSGQDNGLMTVDQLKNGTSKYASKMVDVRGEIIMDFHGPTLCDQKGTQCFFIVEPINVDPKPNYELKKDHMYDEYKRLAIEIGLVQRRDGKSKLMATLRGRYDNYLIMPNGQEVIIKKRKKEDLVRCRFVLQKVLDLDVEPMDENRTR